MMHFQELQSATAWPPRGASVARLSSLTAGYACTYAVEILMPLKV